MALSKSDDKDESIEMPSVKGSVEEASTESSPQEYRLYRRRWIGLVALVILNVVSGMNLVWFGPIANSVAQDFGFSLDQVNWLGNAVNVVYLPAAVVVPYLYRRIGLRWTCYIGGILFVVSAWVRYAGTARSLSSNGSLALVMLGQLLGGFSVPIFQVVIPSYSERWFDLKQRTTATMMIGLANPVGNALGQLIPPLITSTRQSLLVMAIIFTVAAPFVLLVGEAPPTPPTFAATHNRSSMRSLFLAMTGKTPRDDYTFMSVRQRIDFAIMVVTFGILVGVINAFGVLTGQQLEPYGYSEDTAGLMGAVLLLVGLVAAIVTAPLYDRVFTRHLSLSVKVILPIMAAAWIALIFEIKPNNTGVLYALVAIIGATSLSLLPVVLELAVELTRNADCSSAILWFSTNLFGLIFVLVEGALRAGPDADPPLNMHRAFIFQACLVSASVVLVYGVEGKQTRRAQDELKRDEAAAAQQRAGVQVREVPAEERVAEEGAEAV